MTQPIWSHAADVIAMPVCVIIASEEDNDALAIKATLERHGCSARIVPTASQALSACRAGHIDLVVAQVVFGIGMNGVELAEKLRGAEPKVILFSRFTERVLRNLLGFPPDGIPFFPVPLSFAALQVSLEWFCMAAQWQHD